MTIKTIVLIAGIVFVGYFLFMMPPHTIPDCYEWTTDDKCAYKCMVNLEAYYNIDLTNSTEEYQECLFTNCSRNISGEYGQTFPSVEALNWLLMEEVC